MSYGEDLSEVEIEGLEVILKYGLDQESPLVISQEMGNWTIQMLIDWIGEQFQIMGIQQTTKGENLFFVTDNQGGVEQTIDLNNDRDVASYWNDLERYRKVRLM